MILNYTLKPKIYPVLQVDLSDLKELKNFVGHGRVIECNSQKAIIYDLNNEKTTVWHKNLLLKHPNGLVQLISLEELEYEFEYKQ